MLTSKLYIIIDLVKILKFSLKLGFFSDERFRDDRWIIVQK